MTKLSKRPFVLIIRDGWGENPHPEMDAYNAVKLGKHPVCDALMRDLKAQATFVWIGPYKSHSVNPCSRRKMRCR